MMNKGILNHEELFEEMRVRRQMYLFFSKVFLKEFDDTEIERLAAKCVLPSLSPRMDEGYTRLRQVLKVGGIDFRTRLAVDYARVFLGAGIVEGTSAVPYESIYMSKDHLIMQESRDQVLEFYRAEGMAVDPELHTPEDHAGFEMEYMAFMAGRSAEALEGSDDERLEHLLSAQLEFVKTHLLNWFEPLKKSVVEYARYDFYPALMEIAIGYLEVDKGNLELLLDSDGGRA